MFVLKKTIEENHSCQSLKIYKGTIYKHKYLEDLVLVFFGPLAITTPSSEASLNPNAEVLIVDLAIVIVFYKISVGYLE